MTTKRFTVEDGLEDVLFWEIIDKENEDMTCGEFANLLNELHEENTMLKERRHEDINELAVIAMKYQALERENEQLKTTIQQLRTDNTKQKKKLNTTMKENEHIKTTIKDMINTERTEIGKMTLRQLWRQIQ